MSKLTDAQWERIRHHFPEENRPSKARGRPPVPTRAVLEAVLWVLVTGAQGHMLPQCYPNYKTVHRRFQQWCRSEVIREILVDLTNELREVGVLDEREAFIGATFVPARGGGAEVGRTKVGKGRKIMAIVDRHGLPLSVSTHVANHHEVRLVQLYVDFYLVEAKPHDLIGDHAYDSDEETYRDKYPKAVTCLERDREALLAFYDFPAVHWQHIRTTNAIESAFATIRYRSDRAKGCVSRATMLAMLYKLGMEAQKRWRRIRSFGYLAKVIGNVRYRDGIEVSGNAEARGSAA